MNSIHRLKKYFTVAALLVAGAALATEAQAALLFDLGSSNFDASAAGWATGSGTSSSSATFNTFQGVGNGASSQGWTFGGLPAGPLPDLSSFSSDQFTFSARLGGTHTDGTIEFWLWDPTFSSFAIYDINTAALNASTFDSAVSVTTLDAPIWYGGALAGDAGAGDPFNLTFLSNIGGMQFSTKGSSTLTMDLQVSQVAAGAVPEPATYAAIFGLLAMGYVVVRRHRTKMGRV